MFIKKSMVVSLIVCFLCAGFHQPAFASNESVAPKKREQKTDCFGHCSLTDLVIVYFIYTSPVIFLALATIGDEFLFGKKCSVERLSRYPKPQGYELIKSWGIHTFMRLKNFNDKSDLVKSISNGSWNNETVSYALHQNCLNTCVALYERNQNNKSSKKSKQICQSKKFDWKNKVCYMKRQNQTNRKNVNRGKQRHH